MFTKILIANRGEIACRIIKTAKALGISTVAVYSDADKEALHVQLADEAYHIGPAPSGDSYLNGKKIIEVAKAAKAQAIHPGYGFLSENAEFASRCQKTKLVFIGPPVAAIKAMGSKSTAKQIMEKAAVPLVPGYHGEKQERKFLKSEAEQIGYPIMLKAAAGGGGKGMRIVNSAPEFNDAFISAKREAMASFGDDKMLLEKYINKPRHIEIQIFADSHGNVIHLFERDCSIQRRHQKIIEEAPAPNLNHDIRQQMGAAAIKAARAINYVGAGTIEFLMDAHHNFYFMEMNTRLQVEHPVTEMITGLDLVEWQLRIAANEKLPLSQAEVTMKGHAIELRIYAEDPENNFLPSIGTIEYLQEPTLNKHIRFDSSLTNKTVVSPYYDPMLAKLIVWDKSRKTAIALLQKQLQNLQIVGVKTNVSFLNKILSTKAFQKADIDTGFIDKHQAELSMAKAPLPNKIIALASLYNLYHQQQELEKLKLKNDPFSPWHSNDSWRLNLKLQQELRFLYQDQQLCILVNIAADHYLLEFNKQQISISGELMDDNSWDVTIDGNKFTANIVLSDHTLNIFFEGMLYNLDIYNPTLAYDAEDEISNSMSAPMPGTVVAIFAKAGKDVKRGENLLVIEAMKMEHTIQAPAAGTVKKIHYNIGDMVDEGAELLTFETIEE